MISRRRLIVGLLILIFPVAVVQGLKRTSWGPQLSAPQARQLGDPAAKVVIVEYSDFQCPSCARMQPIVHQFLDLYKGKVRVVYKFFPLPMIHRNAMAAAHAAQCASEQNQFWPYADQLFATQDQWKDLLDPATSYLAIGAQTPKVDMTKFGVCYADPTKLDTVKADLAEGTQHEVNATPTFFINGERLVGGVFASDGAREIERQLRDR